MKMRRRALGVLALLWGCAGEDIAAPLDHVGEFALTGGFPVVIVRSGPAPGAGAPVPIFDNLSDGISAVAPGGTIRVLPGSYVVEGVVINKPVTIQGPGNGTAVIRLRDLDDNSKQASFWVDGVSSGLVQFRNLSFDNQSPAFRSYSIRPEGTYDQVIVDASSFSGTGTGGIRMGTNTVTDAHVIVRNSSFTGVGLGVVGTAVRLEVLGSSFSNLTSRGVHYQSGATGRVENSTFESCGSSNCIIVFSGGTDVEVKNNQFTNCGRRGCVAANTGTNVDVINNQFADATTGVDPFFHHVILFFGSGTTGRAEGNVIDGCGVGQCIDVSFGPNVLVSNNHITVYDAHGTRFGIVGFGGFDPDDPASNPPTLTIEDNTIVGVGGTASTDPDIPSAYAIDETGIQIENGTATVFRNSVTNAHRGFFAVNGGTFTDGGDNVVDQVLTGVASFNQSAATIHSSDFTNYHFSIKGDFDPGSLTCNWWGTILGPQEADGPVVGIPVDVYTPWATAPVAGTATTTCSGGLLP